MGVRLHPSKHCFLGSVTCLICLTLAWPPVELSLDLEIDEGEFSRAMLGYKLQLLKTEFERTERKLSTWIVAGTTLKKLEHIASEIKRLEAEFRCGRYYPDLLDNRSSLIAKNFG
jgi:hypothetical protein